MKKPLIFCFSSDLWFIVTTSIVNVHFVGYNVHYRIQEGISNYKSKIHTPIFKRIGGGGSAKDGMNFSLPDLNLSLSLILDKLSIRRLLSHESNISFDSMTHPFHDPHDMVKRHCLILQLLLLFLKK